MKIEKSEISEADVIDHCCSNLYNKKYAYISCVDLHETDIEIYKKWLLECEVLNQDYFFMFIETGEEYKQLVGCSSFRIANLYDSSVFVMNTTSLREFELESILSRWYKSADHFLISGAINRIFKQLTQSDI